MWQARCSDCGKPEFIPVEDGGFTCEPCSQENLSVEDLIKNMKEAYQYHILENHRRREKQADSERKMRELSMMTQLFNQARSFSSMSRAYLALNTRITHDEFLSLSKDILESEAKLINNLTTKKI